MKPGPSTRVVAKSPMVTPMSSPPGLARIRRTMARDMSMPCTGTPRRASGSAIRPVPMPNSSARASPSAPGPPARPAIRSTTGSTASGPNTSSEGSSGAPS